MSDPFTEILSVVDEAVQLAGDAVKAAEEARKPAPADVTLVKVAKDRYRQAAEELVKSGAFPQDTVDGLAKNLEEAGPVRFLELLEKMASTAVFPLGADYLHPDGDLVDRPSSERRTDGADPGSKIAVWQDAMIEAGFD